MRNKSYNRTILELKFQKPFLELPKLWPYNRTILELKYHLHHCY